MSAPVDLVDRGELAWRCWAGEAVVYQMRTGAVHHLEGLPAAVFAELAEGGARTADALTAWLADAADLPPPQVAPSLAASLETLSRCQLIVPPPPSP